MQEQGAASHSPASHSHASHPLSALTALTRSCCASMIMSPFVLDRNVPLIGPPKGGQIGADTDEPEGVRKGRSAGAGAEPAAERGGCGSCDGPQLSAGEAAVEAVSRGRGCGSEAPQRRT